MRLDRVQLELEIVRSARGAGAESGPDALAPAPARSSAGGPALQRPCRLDACGPPFGETFLLARLPILELQGQRSVDYSNPRKDEG